MTKVTVIRIYTRLVILIIHVDNIKFKTIQNILPEQYRFLLGKKPYYLHVI
jgi:hypothetical protein